MAYGINRMEDDPKACTETVLNYYRNFIAGRRREKLPLPSDMTLCLRNVSFHIAYLLILKLGEAE